MNVSKPHNLPLLKVDSLSFSYSRNSRLIDSVSFNLSVNQILLLKGSNGSGKSTLLKLLCGLLKPDSGKLEPKVAMELYSPQFHLYQNLTVEENLLFFSKIKKISAKKYQDTLDILALGELLHKPYHQLSFGQQTRANLCRCLMSEAQIYCLDEPTTGLDDENAERIVSAIETLKTEGQKSFVIATHDTGWFKKADIVVTLLKGGLIT